MKELAKTFPPITKATWIEQIQNDLKGKSLDELEFEWLEGEKITPFHHAGDLEGQIVSLPDNFFSDAPVIIEWIKVADDNDAEVNAKVLNALKYGAQEIIFETSIAREVSPWLENVHLEMVRVAFSMAASEVIKSIEVIKKLPDQTSLRIIRDDSLPAGSFQLLLESLSSINIPFTMVYPIKSQMSWMKDVATHIQNCVQDRLAWKSFHKDKEYFERCAFAFEPGQQYLRQIVQSRSFHLAILNIAESEGAPLSRSILETHIFPSGHLDAESNLISAASIALAASLTGNRAVCIHPMPEKNSGSYFSRISRNIHHLLQLESGIYKGIDPLAGAYGIDYYTKRWAEQILSHVPLK